VATKSPSLPPKTIKPTAKPLTPSQNEIVLNPNYTFDRFVVGSSNRLAHAAALSVAKKPGDSYNPLFLYGGVGLGKTHLMQAIGNEILKRGNTKVLYVSCEKFTNDYIEAVRSGKAARFKDKYRNIDVLLIDDIQFLVGKESTQEEFYHTFNALHQNNKQIVISSDRPPKALSSLEDRLVSRFEGGMIADISPPDFETRLAILKKRQREKNYYIDDEILELIATKVQQNIRELEGAFTRLVANCQLSGEKPTLERAQQLLSSYDLPRATGLTFEKVLNKISEFYGLNKEDILNQKRDRELVHPRQVMMYILRHELNYSYPKIGKELKRDHTTVIHGCEKIEKAIVQNDGLKQEISLIKNRLYNE
jgi:chromosomal replication initiator protein